MEKVNLNNLGGISESLLIPLYYRAKENEQRHPILIDTKASEVLSQIDYKFPRLRLGSMLNLTTVMRMRHFDQLTKDFLARNPEGIVVDIGCGLDTRFYRVDNGQVLWYDLDLPEVIAIRRMLLPESSRCRYISSSVLDLTWLEEIRGFPERPVIFIAEGVFFYFGEEDVKRLVLALQERFPGSELVFDATSRLVLWLQRFNQVVWKVGKLAKGWGLRNSKGLERWSDGIRLLDEWFYFDDPEPRLGLYQLFRFVPVLNKISRIVHYRLGEKVAN